MVNEVWDIVDLLIESAEINIAGDYIEYADGEYAAEIPMSKKYLVVLLLEHLRMKRGETETGEQGQEEHLPSAT